MTNCKHCKREFDKKDIANHSRWCDLNPKRNQYNKDLSKARAAKKNFNNQYTYGAVLSNETKEKLRLASTGKKHTKETKQLLKEKALTSTHRRLRKGVVEYKGVLLDSPEYDKYLDPKNKHAIKVQENKLKILLTQYKNIDIIDSIEGCRTFTI